MRIKVIGIDAAFANMGFARTTVVVGATGAIDITCDGLALVSTEPVKKVMRVRKSSDRLRRAHELREALISACEGATYAFIEVPSGTQNASAAFGLGIAVGVLASCPIPIIEVQPMEVKAAVAGRVVKKGAEKSAVIDWAVARWPDAPWRRAAARTKTLPAGRLTADNEHLADALAAVVAGCATPEFQRLIALARAPGAGLEAPAVYLPHATPRLDHIRSAPRRVSLNELPLVAVPVARRAVRT